jgi:hypothetical protein
MKNLNSKKDGLVPKIFVAKSGTIQCEPYVSGNRPYGSELQRYKNLQHEKWPSLLFSQIQHQRDAIFKTVISFNGNGLTVYLIRSRIIKWAKRTLRQVLVSISQSETCLIYRLLVPPQSTVKSGHFDRIRILSVQRF